MKQELHIIDVCYVTDVTNPRPEHVIPMGRIAQVRVGGHVGLATAIRARLSKDELDRVGAMSRRAMEYPNKALTGIFKEVASSTDLFARLSQDFSGALRFGNVTKRVLEITATDADVSSQAYLKRLKMEISRELAEEFKREMLQRQAQTTAVTPKARAGMAAAAGAAPGGAARHGSMHLLQGVFPAAAGLN